MSENAPFLIVGNWRMNGLRTDLDEARRLADGLKGRSSAVRVVLCPPVTLLAPMALALKGSTVAIGGQDCHAAPAGAHTGDISAPMLAEAGAAWVILGHSERRHGCGESDAIVAAKALSAARAGLIPIICVGASKLETVIQSETAGSVPLALASQPFAVAYEPLWGSQAEPPSLEMIARAHGVIRKTLVERLGDGGRRAPILYGGPVDAGAAAAVLALQDVGGLLVGEASLQVRTFLPIIEAAETAGRAAGLRSLGHVAFGAA